jgi:hypothetical protein
MQWWNDVVDWINSARGMRIITTAIIPFVAIVIAGVVAALIARSMAKRVIGHQDREIKAAAIMALIGAGRRAAIWSTLGSDEKQHVDALISESDLRMRLLPVSGAIAAADWATHELAAMKKNSSNFSFQAEQTFFDYRDRLLDWQLKPAKAKKLFAYDLVQWQHEDSNTSPSSLVLQQQEWAADSSTPTTAMPVTAVSPTATTPSAAVAPSAPVGSASTATAVTPVAAPDSASTPAHAPNFAPRTEPTPVAETPVAETPVVEEPVAEEPAAEQPVAEDVSEPQVIEATIDEPAEHEPGAEEATDEPITNATSSEEPTPRFLSDDDAADHDDHSSYDEATENSASDNDAQDNDTLVLPAEGAFADRDAEDDKAEAASAGQTDSYGADSQGADSYGADSYGAAEDPADVEAVDDSTSPFAPPVNAGAVRARIAPEQSLGNN